MGAIKNPRHPAPGGGLSGSRPFPTGREVSSYSQTMFGQYRVEDSGSLRAKAQELRANAIRLRIEAADVFCDVVENAIRWQPRERAERSLQMVHRALAEIRRHLGEPHHVAPQAAAELSNMLPEVEVKARRLERRLHARYD
jgi:hypothetical protein